MKINIQKNKRLVTSVAIFIFFTIYVALINMLNQEIANDTIWCFHMSQKVANGYLMYSEISTVVTPIYFWLGGLFVKLFGNSIISLHIYGGIVLGIIATVLYNISVEVMKKENKFMFPLFILFTFFYTRRLMLSNYNSLAAMWVLIAMFFEVRKENKETYKTKYNLLIGVFLGLAFFTKQNIGALGVIATGIISLVNNLYYKKENPVKEIFLKASGFLCVTLTMLIYLLISHTTLDFLDFCIGGLLEFGSENLAIGINGKIIWTIILISVGLCFSFEKDKDNIIFINTIYLITSCFVIYPLTNSYHVMLGTLVAYPLIVSIMEKCLANKNMLYLFIATMIMYICLFSENLGIIETGIQAVLYKADMMDNLIIGLNVLVMTVIIAISIMKDNAVISARGVVISSCITLVLLVPLYTYRIKDSKVVPEGLEIYAYQAISKEKLEYIDNVIQYILKKESEGYNVYVVSQDASYYMAPLGRNNYKYDLTLYGSLGLAGEAGLIDDTEKLENALLLKETKLMHQEPIKFDEYVRENYEKVDQIENLVVYQKIEN